jgi:hypothetical protein
MPAKRVNGKRAEPTASPMRKKATAQLLRAQKDKVGAKILRVRGAAAQRRSQIFSRHQKH